MLKNLVKVYQWLPYWGGFLKSPLLLLCRLYWGWHFMETGWSKLNHISNLIELLDKQHFPFPEAFAYLVACIEFFGGLGLFLGFASRLAAIPLIITMCVAYLTVHSESLLVIFQTPSVFVSQPPFNFLLTALLVFAFGPGRFSVDTMLEKWLFSRAEAIPKHQHPPNKILH